MRKPWRLSRQARASLVEIAAWTEDTFGKRQSEIYEADLIARCEAIAAGTVVSQSCQRFIHPGLSDVFRMVRAGSHFVVFIDRPEMIAILDFIHVRRDLPSSFGKLALPPDGDD